MTRERHIRLGTDHELLLRAALLDGPESVRAWQGWIETTRIDRLDAGSQRLLPLLGHNLRRQGIQHRALDVFRGFRRRSWSRNQVLFHEASAAVTALRGAGLETMILKGAALAVRYYEDPGLRPMDDVDLLVRPEGFLPATRQLEELGWIPRARLTGLAAEARFRTRAVHFMSRGGGRLDLHAHVLPQAPAAGADRACWKAAIAARLEGAETLVLDPADQLLHVLVHGLAWNEIPSLRWVADAALTLRKTPGLDWDRLLGQARGRENVLALREALGYLRGLLNIPVPRGVLLSLDRTPVSRRARREFRISARPPGLTGELPRHWHIYLRLAGKPAGLRRLLGFPNYLRHAWNIEHSGGILAGAARRAWRLVATFPARPRVR
jgi:hypothetical protein